jgi:hypothetical protein
MNYGVNEIKGLELLKTTDCNEVLKGYFCDVLEVSTDDRANITLDDIVNNKSAIKCGKTELNQNQRLVKIGQDADDFFIWLYKVFIAKNEIDNSDKQFLFQEIRKQINTSTSATKIVTDDITNHVGDIAHGGVAQPLAGEVRVSKVISNILHAVHKDVNFYKQFESTEIPLPKSMDYLLELIQQGNEKQKQKASAKLVLLWEKYGDIKNEAEFGNKKFEMNTLDILNKDVLQKVFLKNFQIYREQGKDLPKHRLEKDGAYNINNVFRLKGGAINTATLVSGSIQDKVRTGNELILNEANQYGNNNNVDLFMKAIMAQSLNKAMDKVIKMADSEWSTKDIRQHKKEILTEIIKFAQKHDGVGKDRDGNSLAKKWEKLQSKNSVLQNVPHSMACAFSKAYQDFMKEAQLYTGQDTDTLMKYKLEYQDLGARLTRIPAKDIPDIVEIAQMPKCTNEEITKIQENFLKKAKESIYCGLTSKGFLTPNEAKHHNLVELANKFLKETNLDHTSVKFCQQVMQLSTDSVRQIFDIPKFNTFEDLKNAVNDAVQKQNTQQR